MESGDTALHLNAVLTLRGHSDKVMDCDIAENGSIAITCSADKTARVWDLRSRSIHKSITLLGHTEAVRECAVSADGTVVSTCSGDGSSRVWNPQNGKEKFALRRKYPRALGCALSGDGTILVASFRETSDVKEPRRGEVVVCNWRTESILNVISASCPSSLHVSNDLSILTLSHDHGKITAYRLGTDQSTIRRWEISCRGFRMTAAGDRVLLSDRDGLQVCSVQNEDSTKDIRLPSRFEGWRDPAISPDGSCVIAPVKGNKLHVWNGTSGTLLAVLEGYDESPTCCAVSMDKECILSGTKSGAVRMHLLPKFVRPKAAATQQNNSSTRTKQEIKQSKEERPSVIEKALRTALVPSAPESTLSLETLTSVLVRTNVQSVSDLYAGHNLVLLAMRAGILTPANIHSLNGEPFYLMNQLYFAISDKVYTDKELRIVRSIGFHAQELGILRDGFAIAAHAEQRMATKRDIARVESGLLGISKRLGVVESRIDAGEQELQKLFHSHNNISNYVHDLSDHVRSLTKSLTDLRVRFKKQQRRQAVASVARCMLSMIPIVGGVAGEAIFSGPQAVELFKDFAGVGKDISAELVSHLAAVDMGNLTIAKYVLSESCLKSVAEEGRSLVNEAICNSSFKSIAVLQKEFSAHLALIQAENENLYMVDMYPARFSIQSRQKFHAVPTKRTLELALVQRRFRMATEGTDPPELPVDRARVELRALLIQAGHHGQIEDYDIDDAYFDAIDTADSEKVSEAVFVKVLRNLEDTLSSKFEQIIEKWKERFSMSAEGKLAIDAAQAAQLVIILAREMKKTSQSVGERSGNMPRGQDIRAALMEADEDGDGRISWGEFLGVARNLLLPENSK